MGRTVTRDEVIPLLIAATVAGLSIGLGEAEITPKPHGFFPVVFLAFAPAVWLSFVVHELGHALAALALTRGRVEVHFQTAKARDRFAIGRLDCVFDPATGTYAQTPLGLTAARNAVTALAGPAASIALTGAAVVLAVSTIHESAFLFWLGVIVAAAGAVGVVQLVPFRSGAVPGTDISDRSDGLQLLSVIAPRLAARWFVPEGRVSEPPSAAPPVGIEFSREMQDVVGRAAALAKTSNMGHIGTVEMLYAMTSGMDRLGRTLAEHGLDAADLRELVIQKNSHVTSQNERVDITPALHRSLVRAASIRDLGHSGALEPEHVLVSMIGEQESVLVALLRQRGIDESKLRRSLMQSLHSPN